jgi:hypothetical protein
MRKIGFSHGVLFKVCNVYLKENIQLLKDCGSNALEVNCHHVKEADQMDKIFPFIRSFDYLSLHAPCDTRYGNNQETRALLKKLEDFYIKSDMSLAVVHPDLVDDWEVFADFKINWAIENMDDRKEHFKNLPELKEFFNLHPNWSLVLDVGHCNANDKSMVLANELIVEFRNRIKEIHLSGYETFHDPLYRTRQTEIIDRCKDLEVPIIIESTFQISDGVEGVKKEFDYIMMNLKQIID